MIMIEEYEKIKTKDNQEQEDIFLNCRSEIVLYKKLVENLQGTVNIEKFISS